jgi:ribosomal protein L37E
MSADNWTTCPRCFKRALQDRRNQAQAADDAYGKVPPDEWMRLKEESRMSVPVTDSLREDWEIGVENNGVFKVVYSCSCSVCGFGFDYRHEESAGVNDK